MIKTYKVKVTAMSCSSCEKIIEDGFKNSKGIIKVNANYNTSTILFEYDDAKTNEEYINMRLVKVGYPSRKKDEKFQVVITLLIVLLIYVLLTKLSAFSLFPRITKDMNLLMIFIVGVLSSFHCVFMCGGINMSQCANSSLSGFRVGLLYNGGRILSYTLIGGILGFVGGIFGVSDSFKGMIAIISGIFMIVLALRMLNLLPFLSKVKRLNINIKNSNKHTPFIVGLLNGFMPCGPLQAMQLLALSSGSFLLGATSMFMFGLGTLFLMLLLSVSSNKVVRKIGKKATMISFCVILVLGINIVVYGVSYIRFSTFTPEVVEQKIEDISQNSDVETIQVEVTKYGYPDFQINNNVTTIVNFHVEKRQLTGCNSTLFLIGLKMKIELKEGDNFVELNPENTGVINYSCDMRMLSAKIEVI